MTEQPVPSWDTDLPDDALRRLSPHDKRARFEASLGRKVALMVAAAADTGRKGLGELPGNRTRLRAWKDAKTRLWPWVDPALDHPDGRNRATVNSFFVAVEAVRSRKLKAGTRHSASQRIALLEERNSALEEKTTALKQQVVDLLQQLRARGPSFNDLRR